MIGSLSCLCDNCSMCVRACVRACLRVHFFICQASPAGAEWPGESTVKCCPCIVLLHLPLAAAQKTGVTPTCK